MRRSALLLLIVVGAVGCGPSATAPSRPVTETVKVTPTNREGETVPAAPDNTAVNQRDRHTAAKTPIDQDENKRDIQITADIRKAIVAADGMSVDARNCKIITSGAKVTLRGPVASADEKKQVEKIASEVAGDGNVVSELEVAAK